MTKYLVIFILLAGVSMYSFDRIVEIYKPAKATNISWQEIFKLQKLNKDYVAQGIEVYGHYLFFTIHKKDQESRLLVFKIRSNFQLKHLFTVPFPKEATHVSDLSLYGHTLYAIDYASNNLYEINIKKTIAKHKMVITDTIQTGLSRSGSIIVYDHKGKKRLAITQFLLNDLIQIFDFSTLKQSDKKPIASIKSKYFIQGLYRDGNTLFVSSNKSGKDVIFLTDFTRALTSGKLMNSSTRIIQGPRRMIEDIVMYHGHIITSDEETNAIYISKKKINAFH